MTSFEIMEFKQAIISYTNQVQLPSEVKRMVFKEILEDIQTLANQEVRQELEERRIAMMASASESDKAIPEKSTPKKSGETKKK